MATEVRCPGCGEPTDRVRSCYARTLAETTARYGKKGDPLYVEGRRQYRSFPGEEGKERGVAEVVAGDVQFLGRRKPGPGEVSPDDVA